MYELVNHYPHPFFEDASKVAISIYQPTHRDASHNTQDKLQYKNLLKQVESKLPKHLKPKEVASLMEPLHTLKDDYKLWQNSLDGIAVFASFEGCIVYRLEMAFEPMTQVSKAFHVDPLETYFKAAYEFQVLALSRQSFTVFEGNKEQIWKVTLPEGTPTTLKEILGDETTEPSLTHGSRDGTGRVAVFHGHNDIKDEIDKDTLRFFRHVDHYVTQHISNPSDKPLVLLALKEHQSLFKSLSKNKHLMEEGIELSSSGLNKSAIHKAVKLLFERT